MKILIIGSTGGMGKQLVQQSLDQNHETTALVRDPSKLSFFHKNLTIVKGNVLDKDVLLKALDGKDAVLSALGVGKSLRSNNLIENAVSVLIPAMNATQVKTLNFSIRFWRRRNF
jgi:putative NADH-flavin reductase